MELKDKKIGFAVTGSFCTLSRTLETLKTLKSTGAQITPVLSENVATLDTRFYKARDFIKDVTDICEVTPIMSITDAEPIGPKKLFDLLIVAPCTGNTLAKITYGITDTPVTMAVKAHMRNARPLLIAVSTNDGLAGSAKNIGQLMNYKNVFFVPFTQDDPIKKATSLVAEFEKLTECATLALDKVQMQPVLIK